MALLAAAALAPSTILARYDAALAALREPRVFAVEYALEQTGIRTLEQTHRIFRSGNDERDETVVVNGTRATTPAIRIFRGRPFRYTVAALAPRPSVYAFTMARTVRDGRHVDYVFRLHPRTGKRTFTFTDVTVDGVSFLPLSVGFATSAHDGRGSVSFAKRGKYWVAVGASASAREPGGVAHERLTFWHWRFPGALPPSTFAASRPPASRTPLP